MKKINSELKLGTFIIAGYLLWAFAWFVFSFFIKGTIGSPYSPVSSIELELIKPSFKFLLGTDIYGRSLLEILSAGLIYSIIVGVLVSSISLIFGVLVGYLSVVGHTFVKRFLDIFINLIFIFPKILIAIMVMSITGQSLVGLVFALIITGWPSYAKIARGETIRIMGLSYIEGARAVGVGPIRLFITNVIPALIPVMLIHFVLGVSGVIISEATLGFLGLGGSEYSWGAMLSIAKTVLLEAPYMVIFLSLVMAGLIIGLNLLGDGLRDYLDPQNKD